MSFEIELICDYRINDECHSSKRLAPVATAQLASTAHIVCANLIKTALREQWRKTSRRGWCCPACSVNFLGQEAERRKLAIEG